VLRADPPLPISRDPPIRAVLATAKPLLSREGNRNIVCMFVERKKRGRKIDRQRERQIIQREKKQRTNEQYTLYREEEPIRG